MAKLHSYFVLCPLLDRKSFLGVSRGKDEGDVVVTLGRNVVNKYRLSDQKQIGGWTSKDHLTASVVFDKEQDQYVGVFNHNVIKMWKENTESLERVKKYKFSTRILRVICNGNTCLVVFSNGNCASLQYAVDQRKDCREKSILKTGDVIIDMATYTVQNNQHICYIVQNNKGNLEVITCALQSDLGDIDPSRMQKYKVARPEPHVEMVGKVISVAEPPTVYVLWSNAKIYAFNLTKSTWKLCGTVPWISTKSNVSMEWMGEKHLILFGSDLEEDGAILVAFNVSLGVGSCRYPMKMYCQNSKLYCFNERLILEAGNHLGMLPYALETSRSLSSLIATHDIHQDEHTELADWGVGAVPECDVEEEFQLLLKKGITEQSIVHQLLPPIMADGQSEEVLRAVKQFNDIPEDIIVKLLQYVIKLYEFDDSGLRGESEFRDLLKNKLIHGNILNYIFSLPFSDAILIPHLRDILTLREALFLLMYLSHLLEEDYDEEDLEGFSVDYEKKLLDWCALLMDAFYQQYLITHDEAVTTTVDFTRNVITNMLERVEEITNLLPLLKILLRKNGNADDFEETMSYSIEIMEL